ncbi:MAG: gliding motility-associated C-terminal domain-containing protein [Marinilabiliaceae bacterium]
MCKYINSRVLIDGSTVNASAMPGSTKPTALSGYDVPQSIEVFQVSKDADGNEVLDRLDYIDWENTTDGISPNRFIGSTYNGVGFIRYQTTSGNHRFGVNLSDGSQMGSLVVFPSYQESYTDPKTGKTTFVSTEDLQGKTILVRMNFGFSDLSTSPTENVVDFYFDMIGGDFSNITTTEDLSPNNLAGPGKIKRYFMPCPEDNPVEMKITGEEFPYGKESSFLDNTYSVKYVWKQVSDSWGRGQDVYVTDRNVDSKSYSDATVTSQKTSGRAIYKPLAVIYRNGVNTGCEVETEASYQIYLYQKLEAYNGFENLTSGAKAAEYHSPDAAAIDRFYACYGDDVKYTPSFRQNNLSGITVDLSSNVYWAICQLDDAGNVVDTLQRFQDYAGGDSFTFKNLTKTTSFKVIAEYFDSGKINNGSRHRDGKIAKHPCPTEKIFTIEVRQVTAKSEITLPSQKVCEESDAEISVKVSDLPAGDKPTDYAYRWYYSDDAGSTYKDLNTSDWLKSGDEGWSDPTATVKTTMKDVVYPLRGSGNKYVKFLLANTYKVDATTYYCEIPTEAHFPVYYLPILEKNDDVIACLDQPVSFQIKLDEYSATPDDSSLGMTYQIYKDTVNFESARDIVVPIYGTKDGKNRNNGVAEDDYNVNRVGTTGRFMWWAVLKAHPSDGMWQYKFYTTVKNEGTTCVSHPVETVIDVKPLPVVKVVTPDPVSFCLNCDPSELTVKADLISDYINSLEGADSNVQYHWNWYYPSNAPIDSALISTSTLSGKFSDKKLTTYVGNALFTVYASDNNRCGYQLNFDGTIKTVDNGTYQLPAVQFASAVVKINPKPDFSIELPQNVVCGDGGQAVVKVKSNDSRTVKFTFTPKENTKVLSTNSPVTVSGNSSADFIVNFNEDDIDDDQLFEFDFSAEDADNAEQTCDSISSIKFTVHERPQLNPISDPVKICYGQGQKFSVNFADNIPITTKGLTYWLSSDKEGNSVFSNATPVASVAATQSKSASWTVDKSFSSSYPAGGSFTLYAWVTDENTGCKSDPQPITFVVIPQPTVDNITFTKDAFCRNEDASALVVTANVSTSYTNFNFTDYGLESPKVSYNWSWANGKGASAKSSVVSDNNKLTGDFSGLTSEVSTTANGKRNPLFTVYVTDSYGCGYVLDKNGVATTEPVKKTDASLTVNALPYPYIEEGVKVCANSGTASVRVGSNDNRALILTFSPQKANQPTASSTLNVAANPATSSFVANIVNDDITDITTFVYDVHAADYYPGCSMDTTLSFTVYPTPKLEILPLDAGRVVCQGSDITFSVNPSIKENGNNGSPANYSYQWFVDGVAASTTNSMTWTAPEDATVGLHNVSCVVSYRFADGQECSTAENLTVFVNPRPAISFVSDVTICEGGEATLTGSVTNGYDQNHNGYNNSFTPSVSPALTGSKLYDFVWEYKANPVKTTEYSFSVVNDVTKCESKTPAKVKVSVDRKAHFRVTGLSKTELCEGNHDIEVSISAVNPDEFSSVDWGSLSAAGFTVVSASDTKIVLNGTLSVGTVKIGASNLSAKTEPGCDVVFDNDVNLTVREVPAAPVIAFVSSTNGKDYVCKGQNQQISYKVANPVIGLSYEWFVSPTEPASDATPVATKPASNSQYTVNTSSLTSDTYVWVRAVAARYSTKCPSAFASYKLKVEPVPEPSFSVDDICEGEHGVINITAPVASADNSFTYSFFANNNTTSPLQQGSQMSYTTPALNSSTLYYISVKNDATGCASSNTQVRVVVNRKPVGHTTVSYQDSEGSSVITDPFGKTINRAAFCEGEMGKAIVRLSPTMQTSGTSFTSTLVSVSSGSVSDWSKDSESQWSCASTKVWNEECTLTFSVRDRSTGCESDNFSATVIVKPGLPAPAISINADAQEVCYDVNTPVQITLSSPYVYSSTTVAFAYYLVDKASGSVIAGPFASANGSYSSSTSALGIKKDVYFYAYAYDAASGCLSPVSNSVDVKVNPLPVPTVSVSDSTLCPGESATLTVNEDFEEYYWLDGQTQGLTTKSVDVTLTSSASFRVRVTDMNGCVSIPVGRSVTVFPRPAFHLEADPSTVCQGSKDDVIIKVVPENDLSSSAADKVEFENSYSFSTVAPSTGVVTSRINSNGEREYVVTGHTWTEATESFKATVKSTEAYNACVSEEETVTVYVIGSLPKPEALAPAPQDGTLTDDVHVCKGSTDDLTVSVVNKSAYPTAGNVKYTYHWYSDSEGNNELTTGSVYQVDPANGTITFVPTASINLYVKAVRETEPYCTSELSNVVKVTIESLPAAPAVDDADPKYVCQPEMEGSDVQLLILNPASDNIYHWYTAADDVELGTANGTEPFIITAPTSTTSYYARTESAYGCLSPDKSELVEVKVGTNPEIKEVNKPKSDICSGQATFMSVSVTGDPEGVTYVYEVTSSNPLSTLTGDGAIDASGVLTTPQLHVTDTETLTYTIRAVFAGTCYSQNSVVYTITVHGNPTVDELVLSPNPLCEGEPFDVEVRNAQSHDGSTILKEIRIVDANGNVILSKSDVPSGYYDTFNIAGDVLSSGLTRDMLPISLEIEDANCSFSKQIPLVMNDIPEFNIESKIGGLDIDGAVNFCRNDTILLDLVSQLPDKDSQGNDLKYEYQWYKDNVPVGGAVQSAFMILDSEPDASGTYTLEVTSFRGIVKACSYTRSISVVVNELPEAIIDGEDINGYYCTDGDLDLFGNEGMIKYEWTVDSNPKFTLTKSEGDADFDNHLVKKLSELNINSDGNFGVHLIVTDKFGCKSIDGYADIFTAVPPVISNVYGVEACKDKAFVITVDQDRADYEMTLFESDGVSEVPNCVFDATEHSVTTSTDLDEGDYILRVKDVDSQCTTDTLIYLKRYDIEPVFTLIPDPSNRFYCYNGQVAFDITLEENNGHDDFFEKIEDVKIELVYNFHGNTVHHDAPVSISHNLLHVEFAPNDPLYNFTPSSEPYTVSANVTYKFKSDANGYLSCDNSRDQNLRIVDVPVVLSDPAMPVCLDEPIKFYVDMDNVDVDPADRKFIFYVNGIQVVNANDDYSSNEFSTEEHPEISLKNGDQITAEVVMDRRGNICTSEPLTVSFKGDFNPVIENVNTDDELCLGSDITFDIVSKMPLRVDDPATFVLRKIKNYEIFVIDSKGESKFGDTVDLSGNPVVSTSAKFSYSGEDTSIQFYAVVTDDDDCSYKTNVVTVKINQFKITDIVVSNMNGDVMDTDDLCADIDYSYKAVLADGDGNVIVPGTNYDFTFKMDGVEWSDHSNGAFLIDSVVNSHAVTDGYISMVVDVVNLTTGCKTDATLNLYKPYSENFKFHAKPDPNEKLIEDYQPVSSDPADARKFEICSGEDFSFSVDGSDVTVVYNGKRVVRFVDGAVSEIIDESTISASNITSSVGDDGKRHYQFSIKPSADFNIVSFVVSDGVCEVESDEWQFRKFEPVMVPALTIDDQVDINKDGVVTICQGYYVNFVPSTDEPNYNSGFKFFLDGILVSADDFSSKSYRYFAEIPGTYELEVIPNYGGDNCATTVKIVVEESPSPMVNLEGYAPIDQTGFDWTFAFCENQDLAFALSGAKDYRAYDFTIDGVSSSAFVEEQGAGNPFRQTINLKSLASGNGFSTYKFSVDFIVGECVETGTVTFLVYNNPEAEFINETPKSLIIAGDKVPVEVTPGFARYDFVVNGNTIQSGASNLLDGDDNVINENATIEVVVTNDFGCDTTLVAKVEVLEGIKSKTVVTSSDYYCSEEPGVRISVLDPQDGVTYELVNTSQSVKCVDGSEVSWEPVRVADPNSLNPETFSVIAYYDQLPDQTFDMSNSVSVEEVKSPADAFADDLTAQNCQTVQNSQFTWTVNAADPSNYYWLVAEDGSQFGPMKTTSDKLVIPVYDLLFNAYGATPNGDYKVVARTQRMFGTSAGEFVCEKTLAGTLTIDIPTTELFEVKMSPANGNVCVDDLTGIDIYIESSDYSDDYAHVYVLYQDGVEVDRKTSTSDRGEIRFSNIVVNKAGHYVFSIVCEFSGCSQAMKNTQTLNVFDYPQQQTLTVDNDGYFCYDANGATITVGGQQSGYLYRLFRNGYDAWTSTDDSGAEVTVSYSHTGDDSNAPFTFDGIKEAGSYTVKVYIPALDRFETSCVTELTDVVEVHPSTAPVLPDAHIAKADRTTVGGKSLTVCVDESVRITLLQPEKWDLPNFEVHYKVLDENGNLVTDNEVQDLSNSDRVVFADFTAEIAGLNAGVHSLTLVATQSRKLSDGSVLECAKEFEGVLELYVKNRPSDGSESITVDTKPANPDNDPCYGVDLVVNNANTLVSDSVEYKLFLIDKLSGEASFVSSVKPYDGDEPRFKDIRNGNGDYFVVAYNGACSDEIPPVPVHVENDKYAAVQVLDVEDFMCQGDAGVSAGLVDSEENVIYSLYFVAPDDWTHDFTQQELIDKHPGVKISEFNKATFDHQRVTFTGVDYQDGSQVSDLINRDGYYYVICVKDIDNACPVASPAVNFQSLKLPKSFNLMENRFYCDGNGVQLYVEHSEVDPDAVITYKLYKKDEVGNLTFLSEIVSDGSDMLTFKNGNQDFFVTEGTYAAIALKEYSIEINGQIKKHICTSALATEVEVKSAEPLDNLAFPSETIVACNDAQAEFTLPAEALKSGIIYHLTDDASLPETSSRQTITFDGTGDVTFTNLVRGENIIWASYPNFDCVVEIGRVVLTQHPVIPQNYSVVVCGDDKVNICDRQFLLNGLTYWLVDADGNQVGSVSYDETSDECVTFSNLASQTYVLYGAFGGVNGDCATEMGTIEVINDNLKFSTETIIACVDAQTEFTLPAEALKPGITYLLTDASASPATSSRQTIAYDGTGDVTFTNLANGENIIWASYPNSGCVLEVGRVVFNHYPVIPQNYSGIVCGDDKVNICDRQFLLNGLTYWLVDADGNQVGSVSYDETSDECVTFSNLASQTYVLYGAFGGVNGDCATEMGTIEVINDNLKFSTETIIACVDAQTEFTLPAEALKPGITYLLTDASASPATSSRQTIAYDGTGDVTFTNLANGENIIWASYPNSGCVLEVGRVVLNRNPAIPQNYSGTVCGDENLEVKICDKRFLLNGLTYWLVDADGNQVGSVYYDETSDECVTFSNLTPQSYVLYGAFGGVNGDCATEMGAIEAVNPYANATLYVAGESYAPGTTVEMCPGLFAMANIEVKNAVATKYIFYFTPEGSDQPDVVYEGANNACSLTEYIKNVTAASGKLTFAIETVCGEFNLSDSYTIKIKGNGTSGNHLKATNDAKYCEGIPAVQLYYDDAKVGDIYRLYKVSSDNVIDPGNNNTFDDELMDIQEIPRNITNPSKNLYFNGWGYFGGDNVPEDKDFASAGCYYVETTDEMGCTFISDLVCVEMHDNPIPKSDSAFYAYQDVDGNLDESTFNNEFGYIEGVVALPNPKTDVNYYLVRDGEILITIDSATITPHFANGKNAANTAEYLVFGPIKPYLDEYPNQVVFRNDTIYAGEGVYQIMAVTDCESLSNPVTFIGEELVAYDVEIYLNKNEMSRIVDLIPTYDFVTHSSYKPNRRYIGWSSKIDRVYRPKVVTGSDGYYETDVTETELIDKDEDPYYFRDGYTNVKGTFKEEKSKITYTGKSGASNVWFNIVDDPTNKIAGSYGFINVDYTPADSSVISMRTPSGYFYYMKQPSFYGQEKIKYYVENYQMPGRRSNIATITILCGNESTNDSTSVFLIPNAFSPNGDGLNDYFKIIIPDKYQDNSESKLQVFNRWGTLVYRSSGLKYGEDGDWWDGTSSTSNMVTLGEKLPSGTYYYVFTITFIDKVHAVKSERKMHGYIELRR